VKKDKKEILTGVGSRVGTGGIGAKTKGGASTGAEARGTGAAESAG
jgi:hypothetical protein